MNTDQYIRELLANHDCVIVPDFGGFVGNYGSARIDPHSHRFTPPRKEIGFNRSLSKNDGLLAHHLASGEEIGYAEALLLIRDSVELWNTQLERHQRVKLEEIGTLYMDRNGKLRFEPDLSRNFLQESFGLSGFHALPVKRIVQLDPVVEVPVLDPQEAIEPEPKVIPIASTNEDAPAADKPKRKLRYLFYGAAAAAVLGYIAMVPVQSGFWKDTDFAYSDLNIFSEVCPKYKSIEDQPSLTNLETGSGSKNGLNLDTEAATTLLQFYDPTEEQYMEDHSIVVRLKDEPKKAPEPEEVTADYKFHIVGGCFGERENADRLVKKMQAQGRNASILDQRNGLWRVAIQSFNKRPLALDSLADIKASHHPGAWLLVK